MLCYLISVVAAQQEVQVENCLQEATWVTVASHYEFQFAQPCHISQLAERAEEWRWTDGVREPGEHVVSSSCVISFSAQDYLLVQS